MDEEIKYNEYFLENVLNKFTYERYLNKPETLYRIQNEFLQLRIDIWGDIQRKRRSMSREVPLKDQSGKNFWFLIPPFLEEIIHDIDFIAKDKIDELVTKEIRNNLVEESIIDEAFHSSVIEGAFSTKKRTKELINKKNPKNKSEKMILNNHNGLMFILENLHQDLNEDIFITLHKIISEGTLEEGDLSEKYRDDYVYVWADNAVKTEPIYVAPPHTEVQAMMNDLFNFINSNKPFIHPIVKACIIHFYIAYVHPFFDGNGRVARAFSYMYLLKNKYEFFKFFSISNVVNKKRNKYYKAIKDTEDYDSDLSYFLISYIEMTKDSIYEVIEQLMKELNHASLLQTLVNDEVFLNERQKKYLNYMKRKDNNITTIDHYQSRMKVAYETARRDLTELTELGLFKKVKKGKKYIFKYLGVKGYME
ncbi:Fic family protein [Anaerobacillus isosaccharinicus]|uniref:Fic family protein n=1 Tax=Anaerobacillus isosaccharinicus TaxID=1532552 RepID=A0A1S2LSN2_9BACI|nr:Fic family protein [Anaerobacillus isosaccharinicus]MBA5584446.1 Fic family protein [Anaerobacillus isosaccharinicus]QOY37167.1 Fic family protein [Anaerobacillus isosaccharinicus]